MLELLPVTQKDKLDILLKEEGVSPDAQALAAWERGQMVGCATFQVEEEMAAILSIRWEDDIGLLDGIVRATAALCYEQGARHIQYGDKAWESRMKMVGFAKKDGVMMADLPEYFQKCKS
nr:hypothetical protein [uncultured Solibaculum sp.]